VSILTNAAEADEVEAVLIVVGSPALAPGEPPPLTATWLVAEAAADGDTLTIAVMMG